MLKYYLIIVFCVFFYDGTLIIASNTNEKFYYKHTVLPSAALPRAVSKNGLINNIVKKESKTVPKKGVLNKINEIEDQNIILNLDSSLEKSKDLGLEKKNLSVSVIESNKKIFATSTVKILTSPENSSTVYVAPVREVPDEHNIVKNVIQKTVKKPKPKPEVTIGGKEADEPIPASPTIKSNLGIPRKIDYIVPGIITITALPLLGVAFYVLYKRGRDYWDKRHYRRMDFLIDGMYNE